MASWLSSRKCRELSFRSDNQRTKSACPLCVFSLNADVWSVSLRAEFAHRLMKARKGLAAFTIMAAAVGAWAGLAWNAGLFGAGAAADGRGERRGARGRRAPRRASAPLQKLTWRTKRASSASATARRLAGLLDARRRDAARKRAPRIASLTDVYDPRRLRPGQSVSLFFRAATASPAHRHRVPLRARRLGHRQPHHDGRLCRARSADAADVRDRAHRRAGGDEPLCERA